MNRSRIFMFTLVMVSAASYAMEKNSNDTIFSINKSLKEVNGLLNQEIDTTTESEDKIIELISVAVKKILRSINDMPKTANQTCAPVTKEQLNEFRLATCKTNTALNECLKCYKGILESSTSYNGKRVFDGFKEDLMSESDNLYEKFLCTNSRAAKEAYKNHPRFGQLLSEVESAKSYLTNEKLQDKTQELSNQCSITLVSTITTLMKSLKSVEG